MSLHATVIDPLTEPLPAAWDAFAAAHRLLPSWYSGPLRAIDWCVPVPSSAVVVEEAGGQGPVALFHARHFGPANLGRFATPGRRPAASVTMCRTVPVPGVAGFTFAAGTDEWERREAVMVFQRAVGRRAGRLHLGIVYQNLLGEHLPYLPGGGRLRRALPPRMVLDNQWPDLAGYLAGLPAKWRSQLKKIHRELASDAGLRVAVAGPVEPEEACWLAEVNRQRYTPRLPPLPPLSAQAIAAFGRLPWTRFLTYRDDRDRLLAYAAYYDDGTDLHLIWWGSRGEAWRSNLYFDHYLRLVDIMISSGRRRLLLGGGMHRIKARYGARPEQRWTVWEPLVALGARWWSHLAVREAGQGTRRSDRAGVPGAGTGVSGARPPSRQAAASPTAACRQCGEQASVHVLRQGRRRTRYWCERCGAVVTLRRGEPPETRPGARPPAEPAERGAGAPAARVAVETGADPAAFIPPAMVRWMGRRYRAGSGIGVLARSVLYQRYREWDRHLRALGPTGAAGLAAPGESPPVPGLPPFSMVIGALHDACYSVEQAFLELRGTAGGRPPGWDRALRERVEHARSWLAHQGASLCWIHRRQPDGGLAVPDRSQVAEALTALRAGRSPDPDGSRAAKAALFGTDGGPAPTTLLRGYSTGELTAALAAYLDTGARPLREQVLARLSVDG